VVISGFGGLKRYVICSGQSAANQRCVSNLRRLHYNKFSYDLRPSDDPPFQRRWVTETSVIEDVMCDITSCTSHVVLLSSGI
jgi:hypothetical protein